MINQVSINFDKLKNVVADYNLKDDMLFIRNLDLFVCILNTHITHAKNNVSEFEIAIENLFFKICSDLNRMPENNKILLFSIEGCIGVGKTTFISQIKTVFNQNICFLDEPLSIWQCLYCDGKNLIDNFYISLAKNEYSIFHFYFQSVVIFSRWLLLAFSQNQSDMFLSERSVYSDRYFNYL